MATSRTRDATVSAALGLAIACGYAAVHVYGVFFFEWSPRRAFVVPLLLALQAWLSAGLFIVAHDCMHGSFAPGSRALNRNVGRAALMMYAGLSFDELLLKHHAHHRHVGTNADPDFHAEAPRAALPWFVRFFRAYYSHAQLARITLVATVYCLVLRASLLNIVVFWAVPAVFALLQLFVFGTYLPHRHEDAPFEDDHRARNARFGVLASLVTCFHFGGYHLEHHRFPGVPWWRLPATRAS